MASSLVIGGRRVKFRFFVFIALLIGGILFIVLRNQTTQAYTAVSYGTLDIVHYGQAVLIREETTYSAPAYGKAIYLIAEGAEVEADQHIAVLYKEDFNEEIMREIYDIREKILLYQQGKVVDQLINDDVIRINNELNDMIATIQTSVIKKDFIYMPKMESKLRYLLNNKQNLLDLQVEPDDYLKELFNKEAILVSQMNQWTTDIYASASGIISFVIDGFENILGSSAVDRLTMDDYRHIIETNGAFLDSNKKESMAELDTTVVKAEQPLYRIVDSTEKWYAALVIDSAELYFNIGDAVNAIFYEQEPIQGFVRRVQIEDNRTFLCIEFDSNVENTVNKRILPLQIQKTVEGLLIPENALVQRKGSQGVYLKEDDENIFIETSVHAAADGFVIIEPISGNKALHVHDKVLINNE